MNKLEVQGSGFPADNRTWRFLRDMVNSVHELTALGGENYILKGCEVDGGNITDGFMVLDGELIPFQGGALGTEVTIDETIENTTYLEDIAPADGVGDSKQTYFTRIARFGNDGVATFQWEDLERINPLIEVQRRLVPEQSAIPFWGLLADIPSGWQLCDGTNGTPDLSGLFIVGYDPTDTDHDEIGKQGGDKAVALTVPQLPAHNHSGSVYIPPHTHNYSKSVPGRGYKTKSDDNPHGGYTTEQTSSAGGGNRNFNTGNKGDGQSHENRPPYYTMAYITYVGI